MLRPSSDSTLQWRPGNEIAVTLDDPAREGARRMIAAALEAEVDEYVVSFVDEVDEDAKRLVVRNGRARERRVTVGSGTVAIRVPGVVIADGVVAVGPDLMTGHRGVFCGGDIVPAERTVTTAAGHGRTVARSVDGYLRDAPHASPPQREPAPFDALNTWYYADAPKTVRPRLDAVRRTSTFDEVVLGLDADTALFEARRCLSCGTCMACDNCYGMCPHNAVIKLDPSGSYAYEIDLEHCKGCGICAQECPWRVRVEPEQI